jgi:ribosomal protein L29
LRSELRERHQGLTAEIRKRIARVAFERMERECETDFQLLSSFGTHGVRRFVAWIKTVEAAHRLEAALSVTSRHLRLHHLECPHVPNFERWTSSRLAFPLNVGLDLRWKPRRNANGLAAAVKSRVGPLRNLGSQTFELADNNPLAVPGISTVVDVGSRLADIRLSQRVAGDLSGFDVSYLALIGVGRTGWEIHDAYECDEVVGRLPEVISKAREVVAV